MRRPPSALAALLASGVLVGTLAACGSTDEPGDASPTGPASESPSESPGESAGEPTSSESETAQGDGSGTNAGTVEITFAGDQVEPAGERVEVSVGDELVLEITADAPGSLHVHSQPEQEIHYGPGTTTAAIAVDQPGVMEVESHELGLVVLQIQAS